MNLLPCLSFPGNAAEAVEFYRSVFPRATTEGVAHAGAEGGGELLAVTLVVDGDRLLVLNTPSQEPTSDRVSIVVSMRDQSEIDEVWARLTDGGAEGPCGWCTDRFGVSWQVVPEDIADCLGNADPVKAQRAQAAMMSMTKIDAEALRAAAA